MVTPHSYSSTTPIAFIWMVSLAKVSDIISETSYSAAKLQSALFGGAA